MQVDEFVVDCKVLAHILVGANFDGASADTDCDANLLAFRPERYVRKSLSFESNCDFILAESSVLLITPCRSKNACMRISEHASPAIILRHSVALKYEFGLLSYFLMMEFRDS